jgi:hypothetical protein
MFMGWIKLHRETLEKAIWKCSTAEQKVIFITILMLANHKENQWIWKGQKFCCLPGQFITSLNTLSFYSGCSEQNIRTALVKFEKLDFLTNETTKDGRLITIKNWDKYQSCDIEDNKQSNKEVTNDQQRGNKEVTTNKNNKKEKNDNNDKNKYAEFVFLKDIEYNKLISDYGQHWTNKIIQKLDNYKGSSGKTYKSDYRAILTWVIEDIKKSDEYRQYITKKIREEKLKKTIENQDISIRLQNDLSNIKKVPDVIKTWETDVLHKK